MLNYTDYPSTPWVHLPRPSPTRLYFRSSQAFPLTSCRVHKWGDMPNFPLWSTAASYCTPLWSVVSWLSVTLLPGDIPTPCPPHMLPTYPWYAWPPGCGTPPGPLESPMSPPNSHWRTVAPTESPPYTPYHRPAPLLLSSPTPSRSPPPASAIYPGSDTPTANCCCDRWLYA